MKRLITFTSAALFVSIGAVLAQDAQKAKPQDDPKVLGAEGDRLMKLCGAYGAEQAVLVDKLDDQSTGRVHERAEGRKLVRQLESLQARWGSEYARLESNYAKRKLVLPVFPYHRQTPQIRPFEGLIAIYEKKFPS